MKEKFLRIQNPYFKGKSDKLEVKVIDDTNGVKCLYDPKSKKVNKYLFDNSLWVEDEAKEWVDDNAVVSSSMQHTKASIKRTDKGMIAIASDESLDRDDEVISVDGWDLENYKSNPVLLWQHNRAPAHNQLPIGRAKSIRVQDIDGKRKLVFEPEFDDSTPFNKTVVDMVKKGLLNTFSVGFIGKQKEDNLYKRQELLEISLVPVPSNASATFIQRAKDAGFKKSKALKFVDLKTVVPYRAWEPAPESRSWDGNAAENRAREWAGGPNKEEIDWDMYKSVFTWYDGTEEDNYSVYKLPHHDVIGGDLVTVWRGIVAAMAALMGARGGVDIPEGDKKEVYDHLARHYKQFDQTPPDYKFVEDESLKHMFKVEREITEKKSFYELKKIMRDTKRTINEMEKEKKEKEQRVEEYKKTQKQLGKITEALILHKMGDFVSLKKGGKKTNGD
jgi:HK97 family phage prohead protease